MTKTIMHDILLTGVKENASDWHIREGSNVALRIDGELMEIEFLTSREYLEQAMSEILMPAQRAHYEKTGDADFAIEEMGVGRFRANLHKQRGLISLTLRFVKDKVPEIEVLGLPPQVHQIAEYHRGIIFITGTTGSGKSTTLACMIEHINNSLARHIVTIEDPIEYNFKDNKSVIEQREVGLDCESFDSALIHVLRQDPDVIVIGEMRNRETFETALAAAETGHLVLSTLHTMNAPQAVYRILDMFPHEERESVRKSIATNLGGIICQRLIPRAIGKGVVPCVEILINTPIVSKLIHEDRLEQLPNAIDGGLLDGMMSFNRSLLGLVNEGIITEEAALAVSSNPQALQMNMKGIFLSTDGGSLIGE